MKPYGLSLLSDFTTLNKRYRFDSDPLRVHPERKVRGSKHIAIVFVISAVIAGCGPKPPPPPPPPEEVMPTLEERLEMARAYMDRGRVGDAAGHYRIILEEDPANFEANLNLGTALKVMEDAKYKNQRDYAEIRQYLGTAASLRPNDMRPHLHLGSIAVETEDYRTAIDHLSVAENLAPENESVQEMLGAAFIRTGREQEGKQRLRRVLEINPANETANFELGKIYEKTHKNELAIRHLERALDINPNLDMATWLLARIYFEEHLYQRAADKCRQFLKFHPNDIQSLEILGKIYSEQERDRDMLEVYSRLAQIEPENTTYWSPIVQYYMDIKDYETAKSVLEEALEHNPYYAYGNIRYGQVLMFLGEKELRYGERLVALELFAKAKHHLKQAQIDDRYVSRAARLMDQAEERIKRASGR
jgi:tetratricopeptide (TPR) repeat protein